MNEPSSLLCGLTISMEPSYKNSKAKKNCRRVLWERDEINDHLKKVLENTGSLEILSALKGQYNESNCLRVRSIASGIEDNDEEDPLEYFELEIDVFGEPEISEQITAIIFSDSTGRAICKNLRSSLEQIISEKLPEEEVTWKVEVSEYGE